MIGLIVSCAAAMFIDGTPDTQSMPVIVKGIVIKEFVLGESRHMWQVKFKDLQRREKILAFESNWCKIER